VIEKEQSYPTVRDALFIIFVTFLLLIVVGGVLGESLHVEMIFFLESLIALPVICFVFIKRFDFREIFRWRKVNIDLVLVSVVIGAGTSVVLDEMDRIFQTFLPMPESMIQGINELLKCRTLLDFFIVIFGAVVVAAFAEEMLFRGFFQSTLEKVTDVTKAVLITGFVFAAVHLNPWWFIEILILGVLLGILTWRSNSIFPAIVVHGVNNAIAIAIINVRNSDLVWLQARGHIRPLWVIVGMGMVFLGFYIFYRLTEGRRILS
jgi:membrane protease YdiL (CAAX protease family)